MRNKNDDYVGDSFLGSCDKESVYHNTYIGNICKLIWCRLARRTVFLVRVIKRVYIITRTSVIFCKLIWCRLARRTVGAYDTKVTAVTKEKYLNEQQQSKWKNQGMHIRIYVLKITCVFLVTSNGKSFESMNLRCNVIVLLSRIG